MAPTDHDAHRVTGQPRGLLAVRLRLPVVLLGVALVYGTVGYWLIEDFSVLDGLYMTVTTLTTDAQADRHPQRPLRHLRLRPRGPGRRRRAL